MPVKILPFDWLHERRLPLLLRYVPELSKIDGGVYNEANYWTALKLVALEYFAPMYTKIIKKQKWIKKMYYIDLCSGSGLCDLGGGDIILGSPLVIADSAKQNPFDMVYLIDNDSNKIHALENRIDYLKENVPDFAKFNYTPYSEDCNSRIPKIVDEIKENSKNERDFHCLVFIDPYGMEIDWKTIEYVLNIPSDVIITLQSFQIAYRSVGKAKKFPADYKKLCKFMGKDELDLEAIDNPDKLLNAYKQNIRNFKEIAIDVPIKGMRSSAYFYDWLMAVKETKGKSPWISNIEFAKEKIEKLNGSSVKDALDMLKGRQAPLKKWF